MDDLNRRETIKLATATGVAALVGSFAVAADKEEGGEAGKGKKAKFKVFDLGESKIACGSTAPGEG